MGKAYANRKDVSSRNRNDYYPTPLPLIIELEKLSIIKKSDRVLEPCCGEAKRISGYFNSLGYSFEEKDIVFGNDFLKDDYSGSHYDAVVTNPPFSLWDDFVSKSKEIADKVVLIGRTNYFGAYRRNAEGIWNGLKKVFIFNRQVAYDRMSDDPMRLLCGCLVTGWFYWEKGYSGNPEIEIMDVQKYC